MSQSLEYNNNYKHGMTKTRKANLKGAFKHE